MDPTDLKAFVEQYASSERLATVRKKQLLKSTLAENPPPPPELDECCGSSCCPCVKDLWREALRLWYDARHLSQPT